MDLSEILKVIIPLVIMAVWAMNLLFNKEVQAPARPQQRPMPRPPQEVNAPPPLPANNRGLANYEYAPYPYGESLDQNPDQRARRGDSSGRDDNYASVLAVDPRVLRKSGGGSGLGYGQGSGRRVNKAKAQKKIAASPGVNVNAARSLPTLATSDIGKMVNIPIQFTSLSQSQEATKAQTTNAEAKLLLDSQVIREHVQTPLRLREAILLNEVLQPPVAMRGGSHLRKFMAPRAARAVFGGIRANSPETPQNADLSAT